MNVCARGNEAYGRALGNGNRFCAQPFSLSRCKLRVAHALQPRRSCLGGATVVVVLVAELLKAKQLRVDSINNQGIHVAPIYGYTTKYHQHVS